MSDKQAKAPSLRFQGFTDDWEQRKLGEVAKYRNGKAHEQSICVDGKYTVINSKFVSTNGKIKKKSNELIEPMENGEIAFVLSDVPNGRAIAKTFLVKENDKYTLNQRIAAISPHFGADSQFLSLLLNRNPYFLKFDNGVGQTNLSKKDVEEFKSLYPTSNEQTAIGTFFQSLDHLIALHQRQYDLFQKMKKAYLQKMFPKNDEVIPELRFDNFTNAWEQRKLEEFVERMSFVSEEKNLPRVEYDDIISGQGMLNKDIFLKQVYKKGIKFEVGDILFGKLRPYLKNWFLSNIEGIAVGDWWVLRANQTDNKFLYTLIQSDRYQTVANLSTGTKMPRSDWNIVNNTEFLIPILSEQSQIGTFFQSLDHLIALHQRKPNMSKRAFS